MVKRYHHRTASSSFLAPLPWKKKKTSARGVFRTHILLSKTRKN
jgi:hypothetical protein